MHIKRTEQAYKHIHEYGIYTHIIHIYTTKYVFHS